MDAVAKQPARHISETRITEMHIIREPGVPLGMSIAGGLGSTSPGNYEVRAFVFSICYESQFLDALYKTESIVFKAELNLYFYLYEVQ